MPTPFPNLAGRHPGTNGIGRHPAARYGAAAKYDFDNPQKWHTEESIPLLDEHEMTGPDGKPVATVDRYALEEIAANNNRRVVETGDPATAILGHTSDDPRAPEKPAKGFFVNYQVKPFKRDPETGQVVYAIHGDLKVRPQNKHLIEEYPRRSVELWWGKKEIDPVALLGGTTPERDLSVVIRHARFRHVAMLGGSTPAQSLGMTVRYDRRSNGTVVGCYPVERPRRFNCGPKPMSREDGTMGGMNNGFGGNAMNYSDDEMDTRDAPPDDEGDTGDDPAVAAVLQSKAFKSAIRDAVMEALTAIEGEGSGGGPGMEPPGATGMEPGMEPGMDAPGGEPGMDMPGGEPPMGAAPGGPGMPPREEEAAEFHGERPVKFDDDSMAYSDGAFPGSTNTSIPSFPKVKKPSVPGVTKMNRQQTPVRRPQQTAAPGNDEVIRLRRQVAFLANHYARSQAKELIEACKAEGILFADEQDEIKRLAQLDDAGQKFMVEQYRKNYKRRAADPANPAFPGVARFARPDSGTGADEDFEPKTPQEAQELAAYIARNRLPWEEGVKKFARERKNQGVQQRR